MSYEPKEYLTRPVRVEAMHEPDTGPLNIYAKSIGDGWLEVAVLDPGDGAIVSGSTVEVGPGDSLEIAHPGRKIIKFHLLDDEYDTPETVAEKAAHARMAMETFNQLVTAFGLEKENDDDA
jgi:hypothetical protein